jgi:hypothetical protein
MFLTVIYINLFQHYYNMIKKTNALSKLLLSNMLSNSMKNRIIIMSFFYKISYKTDMLDNIVPQYDGYRLKQSNEDKYTFAILNDGIMVIDFDNNEMNISDIKKSLDVFPFSYVIVKSIGGYHVFVTSRYFNLKNINTLQIMCSFKGSDPLFPFFTYMLGTTNLRMCRKQSEDLSKPMYSFLESYTPVEGKRNGVKIIPKIEKIISNHIKEAENFNDIIVKEKENSRSIVLEKKYTEYENIPESILDPKFKYAEITYNVPDNTTNSDISKLEKLRTIGNPYGLNHQFVIYDYKLSSRKTSKTRIKRRSLKK